MIRSILGHHRPIDPTSDGDVRQHTHAYDAKSDLGYASVPEQMADLAAQRRRWCTYGSPTQPVSLSVVISPGSDVAAVPLKCGDEPWLPMTQADMEEFTSG